MLTAVPDAYNRAGDLLNSILWWITSQKEFIGHRLWLETSLESPGNFFKNINAWSPCSGPGIQIDLAWGYSNSNRIGLWALGFFKDHQSLRSTATGRTIPGKLFQLQRLQQQYRAGRVEVCKGASVLREKDINVKAFLAHWRAWKKFRSVHYTDREISNWQ